MARDALLQLTGATAGSPRETLTVDGTGLGGWVYVGPNRAGHAELSLGGLFDLTTGTETMDATIQIGQDASGTSPVTVGTFPQRVANDRGLDSTEYQDALGDTNPPSRCDFHTTEARPYVAVVFNMSAADSPSAAGTVVDIFVHNEAVLRSGI